MLKPEEYASPKAVAAWLINNVDRDAGEAITHLKVQKLLYYCEAWFLANFDRPLFKQDFEAWAHGPVCREVWAKYKNKSWESLNPERKPRIPDGLEAFLDQVHNQYGQFSAKRLEEISHNEAPWQKAREGIPAGARCDNVIDKTLMRNYYAKKIGKEEIQSI